MSCKCEGILFAEYINRFSIEHPYSIKSVRACSRRTLRLTTKSVLCDLIRRMSSYVISVFPRPHIIDQYARGIFSTTNAFSVTFMSSS